MSNLNFLIDVMWQLNEFSYKTVYSIHYTFPDSLQYTFNDILSVLLISSVVYNLRPDDMNLIMKIRFMRWGWFDSGCNNRFKLDQNTKGDCY